MKLLLTISFALHVLAINCQINVLTKDYLVVFEANSKKFLQISLNSNNSVVELPRIELNNTGKPIPRLIIEHKNENFKLFYIWFNEFDVGILENSKKGTTEKIIDISRRGIRDFAKHPSQDVFYFAAVDLYGRNLSQNAAEDIAKAGSLSTINTLNYNPKEDLIYFFECPSTGIVLRRVKASDKKEMDSTKLNQCLNFISIDFQVQELFGTYGESLYSTETSKLGGKPDLKIIHSISSDSKFAGLTVGSKHLYFTIEGQNGIYKLERNSLKVEKFYERPNGKFEALALFEGDAISPSSGPKSMNLNVVGLIISLLVVFM